MKCYIAKDQHSLDLFKSPPKQVECGIDFHKEWHGNCYWIPEELKQEVLEEFKNICQDKDVIEVDITLNFNYGREYF